MSRSQCCCSKEGKKAFLIIYDTILGFLDLYSIYSNYRNISQCQLAGQPVPFLYSYSMIISVVFIIHVIFNDATCFSEKLSFLVYLKILYSVCVIPEIVMVWNLADIMPVPEAWKGLLDSIYKGILVFSAVMNFLFYIISFLVEFYYIKELKASESLEKNVNNNGPIGVMYPQSNQGYIQPSQAIGYNSQGMYNNNTQGYYAPPTQV